MKRSIRTENFIVVAALAIVISLLASACGRGSLKTITAKNSEIFNDNGQTEQQKNVTAIEEKKIIDAQVENKTVADIPAAKNLAERIAYVQYTESENASNLSIAVEKGDQAFYLKFTNPQATEDGKSIAFNTNDTKEIIASGTTTATDVKLPIVAQVIKTNSGRTVVTIKETSVDKKISEVNSLIRLSNAKVQVDAKDLLKVKDAVVRTRTVQMYAADGTNITSRANRMVIEFKSKEGTDLYNLFTYTDSNSNKTTLKNNNPNSSLDDLEMTISSGDTPINSNIFSINVLNAKTKQTSNIILTLVDKVEVADAAAAAKKDSENINTEEKKDDVSSAAGSTTDEKSDDDGFVQTSIPVGAANAPLEEVPLVMPKAKASTATQTATPAATSTSTPKLTTSLAKSYDFSNERATPVADSSKAVKAKSADKKTAIKKAASSESSNKTFLPYMRRY